MNEKLDKTINNILKLNPSVKNILHNGYKHIVIIYKDFHIRLERRTIMSNNTQVVCCYINEMRQDDYILDETLKKVEKYYEENLSNALGIKVSNELRIRKLEKLV